MSNLENGYFNVDGSGNVRFISYESIGGGMFFVILLVVLSVFVTKIGNYILDNQWIIAIPTLIFATIRTIFFDTETTVIRRIINIVADVIRLLCIYCVLLIIFDKIVTAHWLDRLLFAVFFGGLFAGAYYLLNKLFNMLRLSDLCVLHLVASIIVAAISLYMFFGHNWYWKGYDYTAQFNKATITKCDSRIVGDVVIPVEIKNKAVIKIGERAFSSNEKITSIVIPNGIEMIEEDAFLFCEGLSTISMPLSIKQIERDSFRGCSALQTVYFEGSEEDWGKINIQDNNIQNATVYFES